MQIPSDVRAILERLTAAGFDAVAVGGSVRDALLGKAPDDWDVATKATPDEMHTVFADYRLVDTGFALGTVTVLTEHRPVEVTTYRAESGYRDHRHPDSVSFTDDLAEDLKRRDFTVNAMAYHPVHGLIDLFGGRDDLAAGIIRCVGDPATRFDEDALRIFRGVRFASTLGFAVEPQTAAAMRETAPLLRTVAVERLLVELTKWIVGRDAARTLQTHTAAFTEGIPALAGLDLDDKAVHTFDRLPPAAPIRLAALLSAVPDTEAAVSRMRLANKTAADILAWCAHRADPIPTDRVAVKRMLGAHSFDWCRQLWTWQGLLTDDPDAAARAIQTATQLLDEGACLTRADLAVSGRDVIAWGVPNGTAVGDVLDDLVVAVLADRCDNTTEALYQYWNKKSR